MATLSFEYQHSVIVGDHEYAGKCTLTYSTSTTATAVKVTVSKVVIKSYESSKKTFTYSVSIGGTTVASGSKQVSANGTVTVTLSASKTLSKGHSASTKALALSGSYNSGDASGSASANVSVPALQSWSVTYNAAGGSGAPSSQTKYYGEDLTLSSGRPTRTNYVFYEWWDWDYRNDEEKVIPLYDGYRPGDTYKENAALTLYAVWNAIVSYSANGGSGAPASQVKNYVDDALTLSSTVPVRAGYTFLGWSTSSSATTASYQPGDSYTSDTAVTLYAVWRKNPIAPTISGISVVRSDANGDPADEGTYAKVTATWSVDRSGAGMGSNTGTVTGQIAAQGGSTRTITWQSGTSGTSGTAVALVPNCDVDTQYVVLVTVTNTAQGTGQSTYLSTQRADILTRAYFIMDFAPGGKGVGIGCAAPTEGLEIGFDTQFDGDLTIAGRLSTTQQTFIETLTQGMTSGSNLYQYAQIAGGSSATFSMTSNLMVIFARRGAQWGVWLITTWDSPLKVAGSGTDISVAFNTSTKVATVSKSSAGACVALVLS